MESLQEREAVTRVRQAARSLASTTGLCPREVVRVVWSDRSGYNCDVICNALTGVVPRPIPEWSWLRRDTLRAFDALGCGGQLSYGEGWSNNSKPTRPFCDFVFEMVENNTS
jgi:hypothetical protein